MFSSRASDRNAKPSNEHCASRVQGAATTPPLNSSPSAATDLQAHLPDNYRAKNVRLGRGRVSRRNHNPVRSPNPGRIQVAPGGRRWNNCVHNLYPYDYRLQQPFVYRYGGNQWRAPLFRRFREMPPAPQTFAPLANHLDEIMPMQ